MAVEVESIPPADAGSRALVVAGDATRDGLLGAVDELRVFDRAPSPAEVFELHAARRLTGPTAFASRARPTR